MSEEVGSVFVKHEIEKLVEESVLLVRLLPSVDDAQWEAAPAQVEKPEVEGRGVKGLVDDPTGETVADQSRLQLRQQVRRSEEQVADALVKVRTARRGLELALARWERAEA